MTNDHCIRKTTVPHEERARRHWKSLLNWLLVLIKKILLLAAGLLIIIIKLFSLAVADDDVFTEEFFEKKFLDTSLLKRKWGVC